MSCTGVILAGGGATRFGGAPKGLERVAGERIIDRVASALRPVTDDLLLVANAPHADQWLPGVRTVRDLRAGAGALGGLHAALTHAGTSILLVAWDMPFVSSALLATLRALGENPGHEEVGGPVDERHMDAVLAESDGSRRGVEPLCGWYAQSCLPAINASLDRDDLRVVGFHADARIERVPIDAVRSFGDPARIFSNVNTRADLELVTIGDAPHG